MLKYVNEISVNGERQIASGERTKNVGKLFRLFGQWLPVSAERDKTIVQSLKLPKQRWYLTL